MEQIDHSEVLAEVRLQTDMIVKDADLRGLERPFKIEHILDGELLYTAEAVLPDDDEPRGRILPGDEPWTRELIVRGFHRGDKVSITLKDVGGETLKQNYTL